jgi:hypothetical protein
VNLTETATLLTMCAAYDRRTIGEADVRAWQAVLDDVAFADARDAVVEHYKRTRDWIMPADVRTIAKKARGDRLNRHLELVPDADPDDVPAYLTALREDRMRTADGGGRPIPDLSRLTRRIPS